MLVPKINQLSSIVEQSFWAVRGIVPSISQHHMLHTQGSWPMTSLGIWFTLPTTLTVIGLFFVLKMGLHFFYHNSNMFITCCNVDSADVKGQRLPIPHHTVLTLSPKGKACPVIESVSCWCWQPLPFSGQDLGNHLDNLVRDHPAFEEQIRAAVSTVFPCMVSSLCFYIVSLYMYTHMGIARLASRCNPLSMNMFN